MADQYICKTCDFAEWVPTKTGRPSRIYPGNCQYPLPQLPVCIGLYDARRAEKSPIYVSFKVPCKTWKAIGSKND